MQKPHSPRGSRQTGDTSPPRAATGENQKGRTTTNPRTHHTLPPETTREHKEEQRSMRSTDLQTPSPKRTRHREANNHAPPIFHVSHATISKRSGQRKENVTEQRSHNKPEKTRGEWRPSSSPPRTTTHTPDLHQEPLDLKWRHLDQIQP